MKKISVVVFGVGGVGRSLLEQIVIGRDNVAARANIRFCVTTIVDSAGALSNKDEFDDAALLEIVARKRSGQSISNEAIELAATLESLSGNGSPGIVVDVTAASGMEAVVRTALKNQWGVALANKKPLAGAWEQCRDFFSNPLVRHESTVGGGQPVIATLRYLNDVNDSIHRIEGQMSGCLGFICKELESGTPFSEALKQAKRRGYTEPDPREDLGGHDALRKSLILGRMAGWPMEAGDMEVEALYPDSLSGLTVDQFMEQCAVMDDELQSRFDAAASNGNTLRYVAKVEGGKGKIGLETMPTSSPLANLKYVSFTTDLYHDEALLIGGKGAGVEMTAAGVIGDMITLSREIL